MKKIFYLIYCVAFVLKMSADSFHDRGVYVSDGTLIGHTPVNSFNSSVIQASGLYSLIKLNLALLGEMTPEERAEKLKNLCEPLVEAQEEFNEKFSSLRGSFEYRLAQKSLQKCEKIAPIILEFLEKMDAELGDLYAEEVLQNNDVEDEQAAAMNDRED